MKTNDKFWDCDCEKNYIHKKAEGNYCQECNSFDADMPDSRQNEIEKYYVPSNDKTLDLSNDPTDQDGKRII
jgi:hypothetical protein